MPLHVERTGRGPRLTLVHGFTQSARCWGPEADALAEDHQVLRVDAPGHGRSAAVAADLPRTADLLVEAGGAGTYVGYSMGARMCLHAALAHPDLVRGLVLVSGTPGIEDDAERAARHAQDRETAERLRAQGLPRFLDDWLAQPLFASLPPEAAFREERLAGSVEGLARSLEMAGTGSQQPLWDRLPELRMPVLVVAGALDAKFAAIAERMVAAIGAHAALAVIPGAGHTVHLEAPDAFLGVLRPWLAAHGL